MRIVAGKFKGTQLNTFDYDNIRPTADRVRENIFNKIAFDVFESDVLDLFGGTGGVSLEFVSRGANVTTVDNNDNSIKLIKKNFEKCRVKPNLMCCDYKKALKILQEKKGKFDFIFLDPPFDTDYGEKAISLIGEYGLLKEDGLIIYEHVTGKEFVLPEKMEFVDNKKYGTITVSYIREKDESC